MQTNLNTQYGSARMAFHARYAQHIARAIGKAMAQHGRGRLLYYQAARYAERLVVDGGWFLATGDLHAGKMALTAIGDIEAQGAHELAHALGIFATLIAAAMRKDRAQGAVSGAALITGGFDRAALAEAWRALPNNVIRFPERKAA